MDTPRPTIAAVKGAVRAGGIGLMAACDLVVVQEQTTFALTEVRIGVAPAIISVPILRRVAPSHIAAAMLTGEPFDAVAARSMGLVTHVSADVDATVAALCAGVAEGAPRAVAETKRLLHTVGTLPRDDAFAAMAVLSNELFESSDAARGHGGLRREAPSAMGASARPGEMRGDMTKRTPGRSGRRIEITTPTGLRIAADEWPGDGPPVVLAHGGGQTRHSWGGTAAVLCDHGHRVVSMDLRGHGDSEWAPDGDYHMSAYRDDALAVVRWIGSPVAWVGASLGGMTGLHAVDQAPELFSALVLVDITPRPAAAGVSRILEFMSKDAETGFATLDDAADAIAEYQPHRPRPNGSVGPLEEPASRRRRPLAVALGPGVPEHSDRGNERARS